MKYTFVITIVLIFFSSCSTQSDEDLKEISTKLEKFETQYELIDKTDTLEVILYLKFRESFHSPSYYILRDLIILDIYSSFENSKFKFFNLYAFKNAQDSIKNFSKKIIPFSYNFYTKKDMKESFILHSQCTPLKESKEYIYKHLDIKWITNANNFLWDSNKYDSSFQALKVSHIDSYAPDIITVICGFTLKNCGLIKSDDDRILHGLEKRKNEYTPEYFKENWPNYGNHISNIIEICEN